MNIWVAGEGYAELWDHHFEGATAPSGDWSVTAGAWCGKGRLRRPLVRSSPRRATGSTCTKDPTLDVGRRDWCLRHGSSCVTFGRASMCALARARPGTERSCPGRGGRKIGLCSPGRCWRIWPSATRASTSPCKTTAACASCSGTRLKRSGAPLCLPNHRRPRHDRRGLLRARRLDRAFLLGDHDPAPCRHRPRHCLRDLHRCHAAQLGLHRGLRRRRPRDWRHRLWDGELGTYPTTAGAISTAMDVNTAPFDCGVTVFNPEGTALEYSTVFGGVNLDVPSSIVTDSQGAISSSAPRARRTSPSRPGRSTKTTAVAPESTSTHVAITRAAADCPTAPAFSC